MNQYLCPVLQLSLQECLSRHSNFQDVGDGNFVITASWLGVRLNYTALSFVFILFFLIHVSNWIQLKYLNSAHYLIQFGEFIERIWLASWIMISVSHYYECPYSQKLVNGGVYSDDLGIIGLLAIFQLILHLRCYIFAAVIWNVIYCTAFVTTALITRYFSKNDTVIKCYDESIYHHYN